MLPMSHHDADARLREHIRELGALLGQTMVRQESQSLLDLVEEVRHLVRTDPAAAARTLADVDLPTATRLARAFSIYFDLIKASAVLDLRHACRLRIKSF